MVIITDDKRIYDKDARSATLIMECRERIRVVQTDDKDCSSYCKIYFNNEADINEFIGELQALKMQVRTRSLLDEE